MDHCLFAGGLLGPIFLGEEVEKWWISRRPLESNWPKSYSYTLPLCNKRAELLGTYLPGKCMASASSPLAISDAYLTLPSLSLA
jgi:hypothetical protein